MKYRQRPIAIDAVQWNGQNTLDIQRLAGDVKLRVVGNVLRIHTEAGLELKEGQWLVADKNGGLRVYDAVVFYEAFAPLPDKKTKHEEE